MPKHSLSEEKVIRVNPKHPNAVRAIARLKQSLDVSARERSQLAKKEREGAQRSMNALTRPFAQMVGSDAASSAALAGLRKSRLKSAARLDPRASFRPAPPAASTMLLSLQEHLSFIVPPYDFGWQWGNAQETLADPATGSFGILGESGHFANGSSDRVQGASGVGVLLTTDKPAMVSVRPYIQESWEYVVGAAGAFSSGSAAGGIDASAWLNGNMIDGVHRSGLFNDSRGWAGTDQDSGGGIAWVPDVTVSFNMEPGDVCAVPFGAWIDCDHQSGIGAAGGGGKVQARMAFVVVERFVAG